MYIFAKSLTKLQFNEQTIQISQGQHTGQITIKRANLCVALDVIGLPNQ